MRAPKLHPPARAVFTVLVPMDGKTEGGGRSASHCGGWIIMPTCGVIDGGKVSSFQT